MEAKELRKFARWASTRRKELGMSMYAVGKMTGLHPTAIAKIERNAQDVKLTTFVKICEALNANPARVLVELLG